MKTLLTILLIIFSTTIFAQNWKASFRLNTNLEGVSSDFDRMKEFIVEKDGVFNSISRISTSLYDLGSYDGEISNWGGVGMTFNLSGDFFNKIRARIGVGYQMSVIKIDFLETYNIDQASSLFVANHENFSKKIDYHFSEYHRQSFFKFPIALSYEVLESKLRFEVGYNFQFLYKSSFSSTSSKTGYNLEPETINYTEDLDKRFIQKREFEKWQNYITTGLDWQFGRKWSLELLYKHPLTNVAALSFGAINGRGGVEFGLNYWMNLPEN